MQAVKERLSIETAGGRNSARRSEQGAHRPAERCGVQQEPGHGDPGHPRRVEDRIT